MSSGIKVVDQQAPQNMRLVPDHTNSSSTSNIQNMNDPQEGCGFGDVEVNEPLT